MTKFHHNDKIIVKARKESKMPRFSIIVPVYKAEEYLNDCVDSILSQTYTDFELILVDDGSPDGCPEICDIYANNDGRVSVIHKENGGHTSARTAGLDRASGDYVIYVDSDDYIEHGLLSRINEIIEADNVDIVAFDYVERYSDRTRYMKNFADTGLYTGDKLVDLSSRIIYEPEAENGGALIFSIWSKAIRRTLIKEIQAKIPRTVVIGEDLLAVLIAVGRARSLYILDYCGYNYRILENSVSRSFRRSDLQGLVDFVKVAYDELPEHMKGQVDYYIYTTLYAIAFNNAAVFSSAKDYSDYMKGGITKKLLKGFAAVCGEMSDGSFKDRVKAFLLTHRLYKMIYRLLDK